jgi:glucose-fructose oxidoreductase
MKTWRIAGISFDHMHMGDLLRQVAKHPRAEIVGVSDDSPANSGNLSTTCSELAIPPEQVFRDHVECLTRTHPDIVILCPSTARHAEFTERVAPFGVHVLVEKPFASSLAEADRMIAALAKTGKQLIINWPLAWYPPHVTSKRLLDEGRIGEICEVRYYDGNRGPARHLMDKVETGEQEALEKIKMTWWYRKSEGGGSLLDYLGYGATLGTWYHGGKAPEELMTTTWARPGFEVDEHSITVCRYACGLSKYETRWGTFTDPWVLQPQPKAGFVLVGTQGTIASYDYASTVRVQTRENPEGFDLAVDAPQPRMNGPVEHFIDVLENGVPVHGPLSLPICRTGQRIVDAAVRSAELRRPVRIEEFA